MNLPEQWMKRCLELAHQAALEDEVPVGALVVCNGEIIAEAYNLREHRHSPTAHAELLAIEAAARKLGRWRLNDCILVSSLEPCVMCAGAIFQARFQQVIYGADDQKGGAESLFQILSTKALNHQLEVIAGIEADAAAQVLKDFFKTKRSTPDVAPSDV